MPTRLWRICARLGPGAALAALLSSCLLLPCHSAGADDTRPIEIVVDASDVPRRIVHTQLRIPVRPGPLTFYYPKWIPGQHGPTGPIADMAGLRLQAGGADVAWRRDPVDAYTFHCDVPAGTQTLDVSLDYVPRPNAVTAQLAILNWHEMLVYPAGVSMGDLRVQPALRLPDGWTLGTALPVASESGGVTQFATVSLETLVDSPVLCGTHVRTVPIGPEAGLEHFLVLASDTPSGLDLEPELQTRFDRLVQETGALFGNRPYGAYRFLVALSNRVGGGAIEHHESSFIAASERGLSDDSLRRERAMVIPHEFVHTWNGKYRRPAGMVLRDYQAPQDTRLLWVYEGLTNYLAFVLAGRSGFWDHEYARERLLGIADWSVHRTGRSWRSLEDTAATAHHFFGSRGDWANWRRQVDVYNEGILLWLDVDTLIRDMTQDERSLDDFCRRFFAGADGKAAVKPYTYDDIVAALNTVAPYDWAGYFDTQVRAPAATPPLGGLERGGWRMEYGAEAEDQFTGKAWEFRAALGLRVHPGGNVQDVVPGMAADTAGLAPGMSIVAVNSRRWSMRVMREALDQAATDDAPIQLLIANGDLFDTVALDYHGGLKYPKLERVEGAPDRLGAILTPRVPPAQAETADDPAPPAD